MKLKSIMWMKASVDKNVKKDGLEFDMKHFEGMKPNDIKLVGKRGDYNVFCFSKTPSIYGRDTEK